MGEQAEVVEAGDVTPLEYLEREICELAAHIAAATCRWLLLLAEFDRREGWAGWGVRSCAHWLNWRCGISEVTAREQVRVAHRLAELPRVRDAFAGGELSYSKVRALVRVATPATEGELVELARHATASHLEQMARAYRTVQGPGAVEEANRRHERRYLRWCWDDDGSLVVVARLSPEDGAVVVQAFDATHDVLDAANRDSAESSRPTAADALVAMAETVLEHGPAAREGGERYQAVVVVDAATLAADAPGACHVDDGPALAPEGARRLTCDAGVVVASLGDGGEPLNIGRRTRTIPPAIRRSLKLRDGHCAFPGCTQRRFVDGHHVRHWSQGGETSLPNLVLLCRAHHRCVHEGGYGVRRDGERPFVFTRPDGAVIPRAPALPALTGDIRQLNAASGRRIGPDTGRCLWAGERLDVGLAIDALLCLEGRMH